MTEILTGEAFAAFLQVVVIDIVLAGDNAVVVGMAAAGLPADQRRKVIVVGILAATVLRIVFASVTAELLQIVGLLFAGAVLLLWVAWKMWRELRAEHAAGGEGAVGGAPPPARKSFGQACLQIVLADISMSLDNVLAVAGAAREHPTVLAAGLALSVVLMGVAATLIANLLARHRWIAYVGLLIILYVAIAMMVEGAEDIAHAMAMV